MPFPRVLRPLIVLLAFLGFCALLWTLALPGEGVGQPPIAKRSHLPPEKLIIEDAFNVPELQPLPSDVDTNSNQSMIDVILIGKYAYQNMKIPRSLHGCVKSIISHSYRTPLHLHILADLPSYMRISRTITILEQETKNRIKYTLYDVQKIQEKFSSTIDLIRALFRTRDVGRYSDDIFFITPVFHRFFEGKIHKAIFLDLDLDFRADIGELYAKFAHFKKDQVIGIANDLQPHYRSEFSAYRKYNPTSDVGSPRPGKQGFNTGVMLLDLDRMNNSQLYNHLLNREPLTRLRNKYEFYGYLGHQDFFTLLGMAFPELFYILDCTWNRQLDTSWRNNYPEKVFNAYHSCNGTVKVFHGNGNTIIPKE